MDNYEYITAGMAKIQRLAAYSYRMHDGKHHLTKNKEFILRALKLLREYNAPFWSPSCSSKVLLSHACGRSLHQTFLPRKGSLASSSAL